MILKICTHKHLNTDQIFAELKTYFGKHIGLSSVYKNIQDLVQRGELREVLVLEGKTYYETKIELHAHLVDEKKKLIKDIELPNFDPSIFPEGFDIETINLTVYGNFL